MESGKFACHACACEVGLSDARIDFLSEYGCEQPPLYCNTCFAERLRQIWEVPGEKRVAVCSICGVQTRLCFVPCLDRPVYCRQCFQAKNADEAG